MLTKLLSIAGNSFTETVRQPIYGVMLLVATLMLVFNPALSAYTLGDDNKLLKDLGLSTLLVSGLFLAAFSAAGVLAREIENKTVLTVISKPVGRPTFLVGKFVGLAAALAVAYYLWLIVFLLTMRHKVLERAVQHFDLPVILFGVGALALIFLIGGLCNFLYQMPFPSTAVALAVPLMSLAMALVALIDPEWQLQPFGKDFMDGQILAAALLVFFAVLVLTAVAVAASTRLGQVMTLLICTGVLSVGLVTDFLFGQHRAEHLAADVAYHVVPNIGFLWVTDALTAEKTVTLGYVGLTAAYSLLYVVGALAIGVALFQKREVG